MIEENPLNQYIDNTAPDEGLFSGEYEEFKEKSFYGNPEVVLGITEDLSSIVKPRRQNFFKIIITRPKREFESPTTFFLDKNAAEESIIGNNEVKGVKSTNDYPQMEKAYIEIGLQTANESSEKSFQVPKVRMKNSYSQVEEGMSDILPSYESKANSYLTDPNKVINIENFLNKVRSRMEEALQSNETINVFKNDFNLDRSSYLQSDPFDKKNKQVELRTFRDNSAGNKNKKEKCVNMIRYFGQDYLVHSLYRNMSYEERIKVYGIPYQSQLLFWNFKDMELNTPIWNIDLPSEITFFEFCPDNPDKLVCALTSGQVVYFEFNDLITSLNKFSNPEQMIAQRKCNLLFYSF